MLLIRARGFTRYLLEEFYKYQISTYSAAAGTVFTAQAAIGEGRYRTVGGMTGTASILVSNQSILQRIVRQITNVL